MQRGVSYVLIVFGLFLLALAPLARYYVYPQVKKTPTDTYTRVVSEGTGTYFNRSKLEVVGPTQLQNLRVVRGDVNASSDDIAVYDYFTSTNDMGPDGGILSADRERYAFDRVNSEVVHCCDEEPIHEGVFVKFPFDVEKRTYQFWSPTAHDAFPLDFVSTDTVEDLEVYVFEQDAGPVEIEQVEISGEMAGRPKVDEVTASVMYTAHTRLSVEPTTGLIVSGEQQATQVLEGPDGQEILRLADTDLGYSAESVEDQAELARESISGLSWLSFRIPVLGAILGLVLIVAGLLLAPRAAKNAGEPTPRVQTA